MQGRIEQSKQTGEARRTREEAARQPIARPPIPGAQLGAYAYVVAVDDTAEPPAHDVVVAQGLEFSRSGPTITALTAVGGEEIDVDTLVRLSLHGALVVIEPAGGAAGGGASGTTVVIAGFVRFFS